MPSPRRRRLSRVCWSAWASRSARRAASARSATSGATTSRMRRPMRPSSRGPNSAARVHEVRLRQRAVAASTSAAERRQRPLDHPRLREGRAALPHRGREHRPVAVECLGQAQVGTGRRRTPCGSAARASRRRPALRCRPRARPRRPRIRRRSSASCPSARTSSTRASDFSSAVMKVGFASATAFRDARTPATAPRIGCGGESWSADMTTTLPAPTDTRIADRRAGPVDGSRFRGPPVDGSWPEKLSQRRTGRRP